MVRIHSPRPLSQVESQKAKVNRQYADGGPRPAVRAYAGADRYNLAMLRARRFIVSGRVQGVGFRWFVQDIASLEGLSGWAANLPDGRVEVWAEGESAAVDRLERQIRRGPGPARVERVEVSDEPASGRVGSFVIR